MNIKIMNPKPSDRVETFKNLLSAPTFTSDDQARKVFDALNSNDETERKAALEHLNDGIAIPWHFLKGTLSNNGVWNKYYAPQDIVQKTANGSLLTHTGQNATLLSVYNTDIDELTFDMEWMSVFQFHQVTDSTVGKVVDVHDLTRWELIADGEEIKFFPYKEDEATFLRPLRYGGGCSFSREDFDRNPMVTLNMAIASCRFRSAELQKDNAYTLIQAAFTAANGAGQTTALDPLGLPQTINLARNAVLARNTGKNWGVNFQTTVVHTFAHPDNYGPIEAAFSTWAPTQAVDLLAGAPTPVVNAIKVLPATVVRHYTFNLTATLSGIHTPAAGVVVPKFKNKWATYSPVEFHTGQNWKARKVEVGGDELYNAQTDTDQFQIIQMS